MEILNFGPSGSTPKKRRNRVALVVGALALAAIGSTFAASISLNNGSAIEYGQRLSQALACDASGSVTVAPANTFVNASGSGAFDVDTITVYDTRTASSGTGLGQCAGKYIKVSAYPDASNTPAIQCDVLLGATYATSTSSWTHTISGNACGTGGAVTISTVSTGQASSYADGYQLVFTAPSVAASGISKFTVESHS